MFRRSANGSSASIQPWEDLSTEQWQVRNEFGRPTTMTLDELDAAFKQGEINPRTLVRKVGTYKWLTLATVAGLEQSSPMLESESLVPVTSDTDASGPRIPPPPALPKLDFDDAYQAGLSEHLLPDPDDEGGADAMVAAQLDPGDAGATATRFRSGAARTGEDAGNTRSAGARRAFGLAVVALVGIGSFEGVNGWLARDAAPGPASSLVPR